MARLIRSLAEAEVETLLSWAAREGWNPGLTDARAFYAVDPDGFIGAFVDGQMVAAISAAAYDADFGFIGLYICHQDWRGQGHGKAAWDAGMAHLGNRTIGLDGVPEQQANYASMGFVAAYETVRMTGSVPTAPLRVAQATVPAVKALDRQCFPASREAFLSRWVAPPNQGLMLGEDRLSRGYGVIRKCIEHHKVGPLFACDPAAATLLLQNLAAGSGLVQIDVPASQTTFLALLHGWGFTPGFRTSRMYRGPVPALALNQVFGITSLEFG
ncbi:GNAT family N-acetyltransferase [Devosia sp.]|uniref:GNAT family N-acetyltransferase n=1 Tax=Devosia sp. TaxID=1871048 RepID=UPI00326796DB